MGKLRKVKEVRHMMLETNNKYWPLSNYFTNKLISLKQKICY